MVDGTSDSFLWVEMYEAGGILLVEERGLSREGGDEKEGDWNLIAVP